MAENRAPQIAALRRAIDCLPVRTRHAMLAGIANNTIIVGAYVMDEGICPMLAAHRAGGRTSFIAFARTWDDYCFRGVRKRRRRPRLATDSELLTLRVHIEASLLVEDPTDLAAAVADHRELVGRRAAETPPTEAGPRRPSVHGRLRPGDPDRSRELSRHHGWRWLRIMRSYDEYERAMAELGADESGIERELVPSRD